MSEQEKKTPTEQAPASGASPTPSPSGAPSGASSGQTRPPQSGSRPPQSGSRPPQSGSRPPQSGSRPPQSGSRPPQSGGRPPQRGGRPPQRGGRPPQRGRRPQRGRGRYHRQRRKVCAFCLDKKKPIDYKDVAMLRRFLTERGKIRSRRKTGTCARHQRRLAIAVKRARLVALVPITAEHIRRY